uniref:Uncharacterized protein n=1 Tax=Ananas comosus var. bracteatus TaxID=296719 RepID=A0A6V7P6V6_ANACO|nr:unnamed protein product [Ananas comosus var. bracteatus]
MNRNMRILCDTKIVRNGRSPMDNVCSSCFVNLRFQIHLLTFGSVVNFRLSDAHTGDFLASYVVAASSLLPPFARTKVSSVLPDSASILRKRTDHSRRFDKSSSQKALKQDKVSDFMNRRWRVTCLVPIRILGAQVGSSIGWQPECCQQAVIKRNKPICNPVMVYSESAS